MEVSRGCSVERARLAWRRLMFLVVPLPIVALALALAAVAVWWLLGDDGLQIVLHDFGPAAITRPHQRFG